MMGLRCNRSLSPSTTVFKIVLATLTLILFVPLPVALRSMRAETQAKTTTAAPVEKARLHKRARSAAGLAYAEIKNPGLDLAAHRARLSDLSWAQR